MPAKTVLFDLHLQSNAKMVDFYGWEMPLHYGSSIQEHLAVRNQAGMFDVSHMTVVDLLGAGCRNFLRQLLTNDIDKLTHPGMALYSCMCNEHGGVIDDLIVYQRASDSYRLVLNAGTKEKDLAWLHQQAHGYAIGIQTRPDLAIIAVQGPQALAKIQPLLTPSQQDAISTLQRFEQVEVEHTFFARTGYTGEDGLEIILPHTNAVTLWKLLLEAGIQPCGLAARDSLRLEAGLMLYGQDMDESTTPLESGLAWTVKWEPEDRDFIGMGALLAQKNHVKQKMVGLVLEEKGIMRPHQRVRFEGLPEGIITSGGFSPSLNQSIALARVPAKAQGHAEVEIRGKWLRAQMGKPRFLPSK